MLPVKVLNAPNIYYLCTSKLKERKTQFSYLCYIALTKTLPASNSSKNTNL